MLIDWINDVLVGERIIVKDLAEDLYDGQVLQKLFGKASLFILQYTTLYWLYLTKYPGKLYLNSKIFSDLHLLYSKLALCFHSVEKLEGEKLNVAEVTQSEIAQKQKLQTVLERINEALKVSTRSIKWNVDCRSLELQHESFKSS